MFHQYSSSVSLADYSSYSGAPLFTPGLFAPSAAPASAPDLKPSCFTPLRLDSSMMRGHGLHDKSASSALSSEGSPPDYHHRLADGKHADSDASETSERRSVNSSSPRSAISDSIDQSHDLSKSPGEKASPTSLLLISHFRGYSTSRFQENVHFSSVFDLTSRNGQEIIMMSQLIVHKYFVEKSIFRLRNRRENCENIKIHANKSDYTVSPVNLVSMWRPH